VAIEAGDLASVKRLIATTTTVGAFTMKDFAQKVDKSSVRHNVAVKPAAFRLAKWSLICF
jgi:hypothetical protein